MTETPGGTVDPETAVQGHGWPQTTWTVVAACERNGSEGGMATDLEVQLRAPSPDFAETLAKFAFDREQDLQHAVFGAAGILGWHLRYHTYDSRRSAYGFPDAVLVRAPRVLFVEFKMPKGRLTKDQERWRDELCVCPGVEWHLWTPREWVSGEILDVLRASGRE